MDESSQPIPPELQVIVETEFALEGELSAAQQQQLEAALDTTPGVVSRSLYENKLAISYDPERVTEVKLHALVRNLGIGISGVEIAPVSPEF